MRTILSIMIVALSGSSSSPGQSTCPPTWLGTLGNPSPGNAIAAVMFDDGTGPALHVATNTAVFAGSTTSVAKLRGTVWTSLGTFTHSVGSATLSAVAVFNDGGGPKLYVGGSFTAVSGVPAVSLARWDGTAWSAVPGTLFGSPPVVNALAVIDDGAGPALFVGGSFLGVGGIAASNVARFQSTWSALSTGTNGPVTSLAGYDNGSGLRVYVGGQFSAAGGTPANFLSIWNGSSWSPTTLYLASWGAGWGSGVLALATFDDGSGNALYVGGNFTLPGNPVVANLARLTGTTWSAVGLGVSASGQNAQGRVFSFRTMTLGGQTSLHVGGSFDLAGGLPVSNIARWNSAGWSSMPGSAFAGPVRALAEYADPSGPALFAGPLQPITGGQGFEVWTGTVWRHVGNAPSGPVSAMAVFNDGSGPALFVAGDFQLVGATPASRIAKWNGTTWSPLGTGLSSVTPGGITAVFALTTFDDGTGPALYAAGRFDWAGGVGCNNFARWNGSAWSGLNGGPLGTVYALAAYNHGTGPALYAGGFFASAGGATSNGIARFNGATWSSVSIGVGGFSGAGVNELCVHDDGTGSALYAGGAFTTAGFTGASSIAKWNGSTWSAVGPGLNQSVRALASYNDGSGSALYAGGHFTASGTLAVSGIAKWNGTSWAGVGGGMTPISSTGLPQIVSDLAGSVHPSTPGLYATGLFNAAGGTPANAIARWTGSAWQPLLGGLTGLSLAPACLLDATYLGGHSIFVGGNFSAAGGISSAGLAEWGPAPGPRLHFSQPSGPGGPVRVRNSGLVAGRESFNVVSGVLCTPAPGGGPYFGLCAIDPSILFQQVFSPVGAIPFHFLATSTTTDFGPYPLPFGATFDGVTFDLVPGAVACVSPVVRYTVQ